MKIKSIYAKNYKTYRILDMNLEVNDERPIVLIGGENGCGKTTLFDAIYHALYGLEIKTSGKFEELYNAEERNQNGINDNAEIVLELQFSGNILGTERPYKLRRTYKLLGGKVVESVLFSMDGNTYTYGSGSTTQQRGSNEQIVNSIISANLPAELSNYFLFDAMKTSELLKEEQINKLIMKNINSVMGFNKYEQLRKVSTELLEGKRAARLADENMRKEYSNLTREKNDKEDVLQLMRDDYAQALIYANEYKEQYEQLKAGKNTDEITRDKIHSIEQDINNIYKEESDYKQCAEALGKELETRVLLPKLGTLIKTEVELILNKKQENASGQLSHLNDEHIERLTKDVVRCIAENNRMLGAVLETLDINEIVSEMKKQYNDNNNNDDPYCVLTDTDTSVLRNIANGAVTNPFLDLISKRDRLNAEIQELPQRIMRLKELQKALSGTDYNLIDQYEENNRKIESLRNNIAKAEDEISLLTKKIAAYDIDQPLVPDPQYDMLCKLPNFFKKLSVRLLDAKKANIERMMKEQLNINLRRYAGAIGRVELSSDNSNEICFKIYHRDGNELHLNQLNAGAKQTVMQVLLKVLYEMGDYDPPVMIDTVMGVLDKESREVILEKYFPDLAHQTILLSTDTEITAEHDFEKIQAYVSKTYTLKRSVDVQYTTVENNYFGLKTFD